MQINSVNFFLFRINLNSGYLESLLITYLESILISYLESILIIIYPPHGKEPPSWQRTLMLNTPLY